MNDLVALRTEWKKVHTNTDGIAAENLLTVHVAEGASHLVSFIINLFRIEIFLHILWGRGFETETDARCYKQIITHFYAYKKTQIHTNLAYCDIYKIFI